MILSEKNRECPSTHFIILGMKGYIIQSLITLSGNYDL